jgi:hypothetical protein
VALWDHTNAKVAKRRVLRHLCTFASNLQPVFTDTSGTRRIFLNEVIQSDKVDHAAAHRGHMSVIATQPPQRPGDGPDTHERSETTSETAGEPAIGNVGTIDRVLRVSLGGALAIWTFTRLSGHGPVLVWLFNIAIIALGLDFVVTGVRGYCPLYKRLGWSTTRRRPNR